MPKSRISRVRSIRGKHSFWDMCEEVAKIEGITVNKVVVKATKKYCKKVLDKRKLV